MPYEAHWAGAGGREGGARRGTPAGSGGARRCSGAMLAATTVACFRCHGLPVRSEGRDRAGGEGGGGRGGGGQAGVRGAVCGGWRACAGEGVR